MATSVRPMAPNPHQGDCTLPLLADPQNYVACAWDLRDAPQRRRYWLQLFRDHFPRMLRDGVAEAVDRGISSDDAHARAAQAREQFFDYLGRIEAEPHQFGRLDILTICVQRERALNAVGFVDPFRLAKARENDAALTLLPALLKELDGLSEDERAVQIIKGVFAGNIFDLGATSTAALFDGGSGVDYHRVLTRLAPRPWLIDDLDAWLARWHRAPRHRWALLLVDNAGCDVVLGMIPLARELLRRGTGVILSANSRPTLNDVTHDELTGLVHRIAADDGVLASARSDGRLVLVPSGNGVPLIDLTRISRELVQAVQQRPVDLCIIEGMGRAIESNLDAWLACDAVKIAMIKDQGVADALGGKLYDLVLRFDEAGRH